MASGAGVKVWLGPYCRSGELIGGQAGPAPRRSRLEGRRGRGGAGPFAREPLRCVRAFAVGRADVFGAGTAPPPVGSHERTARRALSPGAGGPLRLRPVFDPVRPQAILSPRRAARPEPRRAPPLAWRPVAWTTPDVVAARPVSMSTSARAIVRRLRPSFPARPIPAAASVSGSETPLLRWRSVEDKAGVKRRGRRPARFFFAHAPVPSSRSQRSGEPGPKPG